MVQSHAVLLNSYLALPVFRNFNINLHWGALERIQNRDQHFSALFDQSLRCRLLCDLVFDVPLFNPLHPFSGLKLVINQSSTLNHHSAPIHAHRLSLFYISADWSQSCQQPSMRSNTIAQLFYLTQLLPAPPCIHGCDWKFKPGHQCSSYRFPANGCVFD